MKKLIYLCLLLSFFSCKKSDQPSSELAKIVGDYYEEQLKLSPISATSNGDNRYNDQLNIDFTDSHRALVKSVLEKYQRSLAAFNRDDLNSNDQITYDLLTRDIKLGLEGLTYPDNLTPLNQFYGFHLTFAQLGSGQVIQPFKTVKDYENWEKRMKRGVAYLDSSIVYFRRGMKQDYVLPKALVAKMIPQFTSFAVKDVKESTFYGPLKQFPADFSEADKQRLTAAYSAAIENEIMPAYARLATFLQEEYLPKARTRRRRLRFAKPKPSELPLLLPSISKVQKMELVRVFSMYLFWTLKNSTPLLEWKVYSCTKRSRDTIIKSACNKKTATYLSFVALAVIRLMRKAGHCIRKV